MIGNLLCLMLIFEFDKITGAWCFHVGGGRALNRTAWPYTRFGEMEGTTPKYTKIEKMSEKPVLFH